MDKQTFQNNHVLREKMSKALADVLEFAFQAADEEEARAVQISFPTDLARDALRNAEHVAIERYKNSLRELAEKPPEVLATAEPTYSGETPFDLLAKEPPETTEI